MLSKSELKKHLRSIGVPNEGILYVLRCLVAPSRRPSGNFGSTHDTYASIKNGFTVNSESRHCEAPFLLWCEFNTDVLLYLCQPEPVKIEYLKDGRKVCHFATYDFLVVTKTEVFVVECKPLETMAKNCQTHPGKYSKGDTDFVCTPAMDFYKTIGINHKIVTEGNFSVSFVRNCMYLLNFNSNRNLATEDQIERIRNSIKQQGTRIRLSDLFDIHGQNLVVSALLQNRIYFDSSKDLLLEPDLVWIYHDHTYLDALRDHLRSNELAAVSELSQLHSAMQIWWETDKWDLVRLRQAPLFNLTLRRPNQLIELTETECLRLIQDQKLYIPLQNGDPSTHAMDFLCSKKSTQVENAIYRKSQLELNSGLPDVSTRSLQRWRKSCEEALQQGDDPLVALIDKSDRKGNRNRRLPDSNFDLLHKYFDQALQPSPGPLKGYFDKYVEAAEKHNIFPCSMKTFYKRFKAYTSPRKRLQKQKGLRAAYAMGPEAREIDLNVDLPYHGDHAFQIAHIDHTPIEMSFISKLNGEPLKGTLQLSTMYDGYSRNILAIYASFEKPSYRATMMLLRECYKRHKRLPIMIAVDRGPDFESLYFDRTLAALVIHKRRRPAGYSRHGANLERIFGVTETEFTHKLRGNKQLQKLGRGQSTSHKPEREAVWTPDDFYSALKEYAYHIYPHVIRAGIADTSLHRFEQSLRTFQDKPGTKVKSDFDFFLATLPQGRGDGYYTLRQNQIKFNHILYRLSEKIETVDGGKHSVLIKYNPYDIRYIWALIEHRWVKLCTCDVLVRECFDKHIRYAHLEVYPRSFTQREAYRRGKASPAVLFENIHQKEKYLFSQKQEHFSANDSKAEELNNDRINLADTENLNVAILENAL